MTYKTNINPELLNVALSTAIKWHSGQKDMGGYDYLFHLMEVANSCETDQQRAVAFLHDILEDTELKEEELRTIVPDVIADAVVAMTRRDGEDYLTQYIPRLAQNPLARYVKIRDLKHNTSIRRFTLVDEKFVVKQIKRYRSAYDYLMNFQ